MVDVSPSLGTQNSQADGKCMHVSESWASIELNICLVPKGPYKKNREDMGDINFHLLPC